MERRFVLFGSVVGGVIVALAVFLILYERDRGAARGPTSAPEPTGAAEPTPRPPAAPPRDDPRHAADALTTDPAVAPSEPEYLAELERLRTSDPAAALRWLDRGDAWYASTGPIAEARGATRITVLVDAGDMKEARRLTREFIERFPESPYRRLVQGQTGIHPRPGAPER